ncbi:MAG: hypothetical protein MJ053_05115 [Elusimicrobiaceae bacterium]|nr:hypothetical protein [Elusimicrobiaceae bacterium]
MKSHFFQVGRNLKSRDGVTILEGLIALGLLATIAVGILGVLLSVSRKNIRPDIREEMVLAVEKAQGKLQLYTALNMDEDIPSNYPQGLCGGDTQPLSLGVTHDIECMLPAICDKNRSDFLYTIASGSVSFPSTILPDSVSLGCPFEYAGPSWLGEEGQNCSPDGVNYADSASLANARKLLKIEFYITCNGFTL